MTEWFLPLFAVGIIFGAFTMYVAEEKNRGAGAWFLLGFLFSIIALLAVIGLPVREKANSSSETEFTCDQCNKMVSKTDKYCPYCGTKFDQ